MEVLCDTEDDSLIFWNALDLIAPFSCNLDSCLDCFSTRVHRQHHVKVEVLCDKFGETWEDIVVEGPRTES